MNTHTNMSASGTESFWPPLFYIMEGEQLKARLPDYIFKIQIFKSVFAFRTSCSQKASYSMSKSSAAFAAV